MADRDTLGNVLYKMGACDPAIEWASQYGPHYGKAWKECNRADWMLWISARSGTSNMALVHALEKCIVSVYGSGITRQDKAIVDQLKKWHCGATTHHFLMASLMEFSMKEISVPVRWAVYTAKSAYAAPHAIHELSLDIGDFCDTMKICADQIRDILPMPVAPTLL